MSTNNATAPANPTGETSPSLLDTILTALEVTGRLDAASPARHPYFNRNRLKDFYIERHPGGYVANLEFDVPAGYPNVLGTPDRSPYLTEREAFLEGAEILCEVLTGSSDLPFIVSGNKLIVVAYCA